MVTVRQDLRSSHEVTRELNKELEGAPFGEPPMHVLRAWGHSVIRIGPESKRRALLILDALFNALDERGHEVRLKFERESGSHRCDLHAVVNGEAVSIALMERTAQKQHVATAEETRRARDSPWFRVPAFDRFATGTLTLELPSARYGVAARFSDGKKQCLEEKLGHVVVRIETEAGEQLAQRDERRRAAERAEIERQRREKERRRQEHISALAADLRQMVQQWSEAASIRAFLKEYDARTAEDARNEATDVWLNWARAFADELDPLVTPEHVAKSTTAWSDS